MKQASKIIVITGPTASGKTELAINLAKKINTEIICADSKIVYKNLDIVSAKPDDKEKNGIIHHLIDIKQINDGLYSAGDFVKDAKEIIKKANKPIIIQGGTWFYIKTLLDNKNLIEFGKNEELRKEFSKLSSEKLYEMLLEKDKKRAELIHKNNRDKVIRSLEIIEAINGRVSEYEREENEKFDALWFMIDYDREELYQRINLRVDKMVNMGLYDEWGKNYKDFGKLDVLYATIGYREFFDLEDGIYKGFNEAVDKIKQHTRNFAKRQLTWFNQNDDIKKMPYSTALQCVTKDIEKWQ